MTVPQIIQLIQFMKGLYESSTKTLKSSSDELLVMKSSVLVHKRTLKLLMTEIYKAKN